MKWPNQHIQTPRMTVDVVSCRLKFKKKYFNIIPRIMTPNIKSQTQHWQCLGIFRNSISVCHHCINFLTIEQICVKFTENIWNVNHIIHRKFKMCLECMIVLISSIKMFVSQRFDFERICFIKAKKHMQDPKVACACNRILQYVLSKSTHDRFEFLAAWMHLEY